MNQYNKQYIICHQSNKSSMINQSHKQFLMNYSIQHITQPFTVSNIHAEVINPTINPLSSIPTTNTQFIKQSNKNAQKIINPTKTAQSIDQSIQQNYSKNQSIQQKLLNQSINPTKILKNQSIQANNALRINEPNIINNQYQNKSVIII